MCGRIGRLSKTCIAAALSCAALAAVPTSVFAGDRDDHRGGHRYDRGDRYSRHDRDDDDRHRSSGRVNIEFRTGGWERVPAPAPCPVEERVWVEPVYRTVCVRVWVPAQYRTVVDKVWVDPVTERRTERVWVPDRYEWREVPCYDYAGRRTTRSERYLAERGRYEMRTCDVVVTPGYFRECPRQELVYEGRWENVERQVLVSAGHWETRRVAVAPPVRYEERASARIGLSIPVRW